VNRLHECAIESYPTLTCREHVGRSRAERCRCATDSSVQYHGASMHGNGVGVVAFPFAKGKPHFLLKPFALLSEITYNMGDLRVPGRGFSRLFLDLLGQVILEPHLLDGFHLRLDPIDMSVHIFRHIFKHMPGGEVGHLRTMHHAIA
jgi:hypothetical protein